MPRFADASWMGVCPRGHVIAAVMNMSTYYCDDCTPTGMDDARQRYMTMPQQDVMLAAFRLGGIDAVRQLAKVLLTGDE